MKTPKILCIYHGNCADGFAAAWAVRHTFTEDLVEFFPATYQEDPPDVTGRNVFIVDFSYKRPVIEEMAKVAKSITIIDHHKTAQADLQSLLDDGTVEGVFDMDRSGAMLTWDFLNPGEEPPVLFDHIQDRDLWRFELEGTREIQAAVFSHPYDFEIWDNLMGLPVGALLNDGAAIERKHFKDIREFIEVAAHRIDIGGFNVPVLNAPYMWASDAAHIMAEGEPFAACYFVDGKKVIFSLRSTDDGVDVSTVAKLYGGGGHKHAAGYSVERPDGARQ